ncbi:TetR/AcrR family transcriptional regulator [Kineothrix sp. MSJ-39]|uniref:TetR/AcrR family transcriptional regulator n=1 Tax=Kineothrix sp. MSJ-39 TaxID=2841533 RepID=UPI001C102C30|nr:TetR/AcrR family transcriptional regulator [Kineothrix sp. MSJ-39]MBU5429999.1 TetR/AcrR family transcriptional regulator [Kineothrix sp. MSJ-39]
MPANFTEEQKREIREKLIATGYGLIRELGLKKMKVSIIAERANIATGTFYHFFDSKEAYIAALIAEQDRAQGERLQVLLTKGNGKLTLEQAIRWFRDSFRTENNILMELTLDDWVWLKSHRTKMGMFNETQAMQEAMQYLAYVDGIRPDLDIRVIINFFKTIYSMAQNRETFIQDVFETNIDMIFACIYHYAAAPK